MRQRRLWRGATLTCLANPCHFNHRDVSQCNLAFRPSSKQLEWQIHSLVSYDYQTKGTTTFRDVGYSGNVRRYQSWWSLARGNRLASVQIPKLHEAQLGTAIKKPIHSIISPSKLGELSHWNKPPFGIWYRVSPGFLNASSRLSELILIHIPIPKKHVPTTIKNHVWTNHPCARKYPLRVPFTTLNKKALATIKTGIRFFLFLNRMGKRTDRLR